MPTIFAAVDRAYPAYEATGSIMLVAAIMAVVLAITGGIVGAVHGLALVRLARRPVGGACDSVQ